MPRPQQRCNPLAAIHKGNFQEGISDAAWAIIKKLKAEKDYVQVHQCERALAQRLNLQNYHHHLAKAIPHGSWEIKIIFMLFFARWYRSLVTPDNAACTLKMVGELVKTFSEESLRKYGMDVLAEEDMEFLTALLRNEELLMPPTARVRPT